MTGTVTYDSVNKIGAFKPLLDFAPNATYNASITTGAMDLNGTPLAAPFNFSFTTRATDDKSPPTIVVVNVAAGATCVPLDTEIQVTFSEPIDSLTLTPTTFFIEGVAGDVTYNVATRLATFKPAANLAVNTTYTIMVTTGVKDMGGVPLAAPIQSTFTTGPCGGGAPSEIVYTIPQDGNNTHAYSVDTTTAEVHEQPGSPFDLGAVDSGNTGTPWIIGSTPNGAFLLIQKMSNGISFPTPSIYVAKADANGIPIFPVTDSRNYGQPGLGLQSLISPSGKCVYVHEFDQFNTIKAYALDANGKLTETGSVQLGETFGPPPGPIYSFGTVTADNSTLILISLAGHTCTSTAVYRLAINQQTGVPSALLPGSPAWATSTCSGTPYHESFSELLAVDSAGQSVNFPPPPVMKAYPFDGVRYTAGATCDSSVKPVCQSLIFAVAPRSSFIVIGDASGTWHSLDKSLNDIGSKVVLPTDVYPQFSADGRLMLLIRDGNDIQMALFDPATGAFKTVTATIPGGFDTWSVISVQP